MSDGNNFDGTCERGTSCEPGAVDGDNFFVAKRNSIVAGVVLRNYETMCLSPGEHLLTYRSDQYGDETEICVSQTRQLPCNLAEISTAKFGDQ